MVLATPLERPTMLGLVKVEPMWVMRMRPSSKSSIWKLVVPLATTKRTAL